MYLFDCLNRISRKIVQFCRGWGCKFSRNLILRGNLSAEISQLATLISANINLFLFTCRHCEVNYTVKHYINFAVLECVFSAF